MNTQTWTPEMMTELAAIRTDVADVRRSMTSPQKQSALQSVIASWTDGLRDMGQSAGAFFTLVGCGGGVGMGLDLMGHTTGAVDYGLGAGMFVGGLTVGARVVLDQLLGEILEFIQGREKTKAVHAPQGQSAPVEMEMGLQVDDGRGGWVTLLHDVPRHRIRKMAHATARGYFRRTATGSERNFSQDHLGRFWGAHLNRVKTRLAAAGKIEKGGNSTYTFTDAGAKWLERIMSER